MDDVSIRLARPADLPAISGIYNHYVLASTCTYQTEPETIEARAAWFAAHSPSSHPVTVAELAGEIVGWGSLSPYNVRSGYRRTVEDSVYVRHDAQRRGTGKALLGDLIDRAGQAGHHTVIAGVDAEQQPSILLHERAGFTRVAHLREVGFKFGRWLDVVYLQRML
jgi:L-amino acid N-acyltransferase